MSHHLLHVSLTQAKTLEVLTSMCAHLSRTSLCCQTPYLKFSSWLLSTCQFLNLPFLSFLWKLLSNTTFVHFKWSCSDFLYLVTLTVLLFLTLCWLTLLLGVKNTTSLQKYHGLSLTYLTSLSPSASGIILWYGTFCQLVLIYLWHLMLPLSLGVSEQYPTYFFHTSYFLSV